MTTNEMVKQLRWQISGLMKEYEKAKGVYDNSGLNADLKAEALNSMATVLQLSNVAIINLGNFNLALSYDVPKPKSVKK